MIISRTPLRISLVGGGSDLAAFYKKRCGAVVSTAIDKYIYVNVNKKFDSGVRIAYSKNEEVSSVSEIEHIPSKVTGLGSSSSFTVGLLHALNAYLGRYVSSEQLAADSCKIEIMMCGEPIGKQDQYAAAFGGFNLIEFRPDESVIVSPLICDPCTLQEVQKNVLILYTGITRSASALLKEQSHAVASCEEKHRTLAEMVRLAYVLRDELQNNNPGAVGEILHENWMLKKSLTAGVSTPVIDGWYETARKAGAAGGKILGAGAGGFLMLYAPTDRHDQIKAALPQLRPIPVAFEPLGSRIIFYH